MPAPSRSRRSRASSPNSGLFCRVSPRLDRDPISSVGSWSVISRWSMILSENRSPLFGIMLWRQIGRNCVSLLILVVDDEPDVEQLFRQQFRRDLRAGRFAMDFAQSAPEALERIAAAEDRSLILILSDINMPGMSGLDLLPKAKAARPDVPIIMITAYGDADTRRKALANGANAFLTKPIDLAIVRNEIDIPVGHAT